TNRSQFFRGMVDKYTWVDVGSSYLPSELQAAYLYGQLTEAELISAKRMAVWQQYNDALKPLQDKGVLTLPQIPADCEHNAHMYYVKVKDIDVRTNLLSYLK